MTNAEKKLIDLLLGGYAIAQLQEAADAVREERLTADVERQFKELQRKENAVRQGWHDFKHDVPVTTLRRWLAEVKAE